MADRRPEDQAQREYLHVLLCDRPTQSVQEVVKRAIRRHGWAGRVVRHAQLTMESLEMGRQRVLSDLRSLIPETLDDNSALPFAIRIKQYLSVFPPRPE